MTPNASAPPTDIRQRLSEPEIAERLEARLGTVHARQRLGIEAEHEAHKFRPRRGLYLENWTHVPALIRAALRLTGLQNRARRNILAIEIREHTVTLPHLPQAFDGLRILHLSDLHIDLSQDLAHSIIERARQLDYDLCVLTGDYRFRTFGDLEATLAGMTSLRTSLTGPVYGVLGNHDSVRMVPHLEDIGIRVLMNEHVTISREQDAIYLAGIDDAHYYGVGNLQKALHDVPADAVSILLSHTPEVYRQAAHAAVDLMLSGHTHGGQICLPGGTPVILEAKIPRRMGRGRWQHQQMVGYTSAGAGSSIVAARLNCPPEITLHVLRAAAANQ